MVVRAAACCTVQTAAQRQHRRKTRVCAAAAAQQAAAASKQAANKAAAAAAAAAPDRRREVRVELHCERIVRPAGAVAPRSAKVLRELHRLGREERDRVGRGAAGGRGGVAQQRERALERACNERRGSEGESGVHAERGSEIEAKLGREWSLSAEGGRAGRGQVHPRSTHPRTRRRSRRPAPLPPPRAPSSSARSAAGGSAAPRGPQRRR